jgi:predicted kinase
VTLLALLAPETGSSALPSRVVLVGGVPGAGKTTVITRIAAEQPGVDALDPETYRDGLRRLLPAGTAYVAYRWLVHTLHALRVLLVLLRGPVPGRTLVVHDPATRPGRRWLFARLARARGWEPVLVYLDVPRVLAETGQVLRGRVVDPTAFAGHWARWEDLRPALVGEPGRLDGALWSQVVLTDRDRAAADLTRLVPGRSVPALG